MIAIPEAPPKLNNGFHRHDGHDTTATGLPTWYGQRVGREERSALSLTGDVELFAGNTFGTSYRSYAKAQKRAVEASEAGQGAVLIMSPVGHDVHGGRFFLVRPYNAEYKFGTGLVVGRHHSNADEKYTTWHAEVHALVDQGKVVPATQQLRR